jgi:NAD(P)-dependent dehydrogenase (short-subunit alcohol dehydrogenase family)
MRDVLDQILDFTVLPGYTSVGYALRRPGWDDDELLRMAGTVALVTGATSGLGLAAASGMARLGARVRILVRNAERGEKARAEVVERTGNDDVAVALCALSSLADIRRFAAEVTEREPRQDVLDTTAGGLPPERPTTDEGLELTFATNVAGPFLLTKLLLPLLRSSAPARVIDVTSGGMYTQRLDVDELQSEHGEFSGTTAYARTKRAEVVLAELWAERLAGTGVVVHSMHPGWADTPGLEASLPGFHKLLKPILRSAEQGADTIVWRAAAREPGRTSGGLWHDRRERATHRVPWTRESSADRAALWAACEAATGGLDGEG